MTSGYSGTPLIKKLGIKDGFKVQLIDEPENYFSLLESLPEVISAENSDLNINFIHLFVKSASDLHLHFTNCKNRLAKDGSLWVSWPKKASKIKTDLDGNTVRAFGLQKGLVDVKVCAIDDTWSGLKFMYRIKDR